MRPKYLFYLLIIIGTLVFAGSKVRASTITASASSNTSDASANSGIASATASASVNISAHSSKENQSDNQTNSLASNLNIKPSKKRPRKQPVRRNFFKQSDNKVLAREAPSKRDNDNRKPQEISVIKSGDYLGQSEFREKISSLEEKVRSLHNLLVTVIVINTLILASIGFLILLAITKEKRPKQQLKELTKL